MASIIKADNIQKVSDGSNIIKKCGSTITVGSSGQTVALASGASQTGFGTPSSSVLWCTTAKTSPFTAADKVGYFVNTSGGVVTVTLPSSPSAGDVVALKDYSNTWDTNKVTVARNGSKINGTCACAILDTESQSVTLIYVDGTKGWQDIHDSTSNVSGNPGFITATGGTIATVDTNYKTHTFTGSGTFAVTNVSGTGVGGKVSYVVIAGGGGGGAGCAGAGGAGGFREGKQACGGYTASPLAATPCSGLPVSVQSYPITIGAGAASRSASPYVTGNNGANSIFSSITSTGGGGGGGGCNAGSPVAGNAGGSGGGGQPGGPPGSRGAGGAGNTPPVSPPQGNAGGPGFNGPGNKGGGGGGAAAAGQVGTPPSSGGGVGGAGVSTSITSSSVQRAGGGGGASSCAPVGSNGGAGGGGPGGYPGGSATDGSANTGGGGGGGGNAPTGAGGSGVVIIRYKFQ